MHSKLIQSQLKWPQCITCSTLQIRFFKKLHLIHTKDGPKQGWRVAWHFKRKCCVKTKSKQKHSARHSVQFCSLKKCASRRATETVSQVIKWVNTERIKMANFENSLEESFLTLCEFRLRKSLESASNNDNKTPTASSVEQVSLLATRSNT